MTDLQGRARQSEFIARASIEKLSNEGLADVWEQTCREQLKREVVIARGWLMDEFEARMEALDRRDAKSPLSLGLAVSRFDQWLMAECRADTSEYVSVLRYLR